jgi:hypothetical protein
MVVRWLTVLECSFVMSHLLIKLVVHWLIFQPANPNIPYSHAYRTAYLTLDDLEITGTQMVLVMKLSTFAWNVYDGRRPEEVCYVHYSSNPPNASYRIWIRLNLQPG